MSERLRFLAGTAALLALGYGYVLALVATWPTAWWIVAAVGGALALVGVARGLDRWIDRATVVALAALIAAAPAHAVRTWVDGFEYGTAPTVPSYSAVVGSPDIESSATTPTGVTGDDWSVEFDGLGTSGNNEYLERTLTPTYESTQQIRLRVNACPTTERALPLGYGTGANRHCFATLAPDCRVRVYYADTGNECTQSENDGTPCDELADCDPIAGESTPSYACSEAVFGKSSALGIGVWYDVMLTQDLSQATEGVSCGLFVNGVNRGSGVRPQGACSGGSDAGDACSVDADCTGGGDCVFSLATSTWARLGAFDGVSATFDVNVSHWIIDGTAVDLDLATARVADLHPSSDGSPNDFARNGCSGSSYLCVDDSIGTGPPDGDSTQLGSTTSAGDAEEWGLTDNTLGGGETVQSDAGVAVWCNAHERNSSNNVAGKLITQCLSTGSATRCGSAYDLNQFGEAYKMVPPVVFVTDQTNTAWSDADLDGLFVRVTDDSACGTPSQCTWNITDCLVQAEITGAVPTLPAGLEDVNGDLEITLCFAGDSTCDGAGFYDALQAQLEQAANIYDGCRGGATIGDISDNLAGILNGTGTAEFPVATVTGTSGQKCDYLYVGMLGNNDLICSPTCPLHGKCFGGANDGGTCQLPLSYAGRKTVGSTELIPYRCREGANALATCVYPTDCCRDWQGGDGTLTGVCRTTQVACDGTTTCAGATGPCKFCSGVPITGNAGNCDIDSPSVGTWCQRGVTDSLDCPGGLCVRRAELAYLKSTFASMLDAALARSGADEVRVVVLANHMPREVTAESGFGCRWRNLRDDLGAFSRSQKTMAIERGLNWIDMRSAFHARSSENLGTPRGLDSDRMLRVQGFSLDGIHPSEPTPGTGTCADGGLCGVQVMADAVEQCAEGTPGPHHSCDRMLSTPTPTP